MIMIDKLNKINKFLQQNIFAKIMFAFLTVLLFAFIRWCFLLSLEGKIAYLTFYPAVMLAAVVGGFYAGFSAITFSCYCTIKTG